MPRKKTDKAVKTTKTGKPTAEKPEKIMGFFRVGTNVGFAASLLVDEKVHRIDAIVSKVKSELKIDEGAAKFAFGVLCLNPYPGGATGKIEYKKLGGVVVNLEEGTVAYSSAKRKTEIIRPKKEEKPDQKVEVEAKA